MTRFTFEAGAAARAAWSPSGAEIVYSTFPGDSYDLYIKPSNGSGEARALVNTPAQEIAATWSPDERFLVYESVSPGTGRDLLYREKQSDGTLGNERVYLRTRFEEGAPAFSPDGHFIAYVSNESGQNEVYVQRFPDGSGKWRVSVNRGAAPRWPRHGKDLFYVEGHRLMAAPATTTSTFSSGTPTALFTKGTLGTFNPQYDVTADGTQIVVTDRVIDEQPLAIHVVHNWFEEFRGRK
jgi:eukaryotic-like serine/threonine-protein kinase